MDHELEGSGNEDWFERVKRHIEGVIFRILKKKYPFLDSVADIEVVDETNFMLQMFLLHKLNDKTATIDVSLVLNH